MSLIYTWPLSKPSGRRMSDCASLVQGLPALTVLWLFFGWNACERPDVLARLYRSHVRHSSAVCRPIPHFHSSQMVDLSEVRGMG